MTIKINTLIILFSCVFMGCQSDILLERQSTDILIQFSDDVSPTNAILTPEHIGIEQTWTIGGEVREPASGDNSGTIELFFNPNTEIYVQYKTVIENVIYTYNEWVKAPPVANKLIIYSFNFYTENFDQQIVSPYVLYSYDLPSEGRSSSGGSTLHYNENSSHFELVINPIDFPLSPALYDVKTPHILNIEIIDNNGSHPSYCVSSEDLQLLYFKYHDASVDNPNLIFFRNNITNLDYQLTVDWTYEPE